MQTRCPHCAGEIELVGAKELADEHGLTLNEIQYARGKGRFPEPWLAFGNRIIYLRSDIERYVKDRGKKRLERTLARLEEDLAQLTDGDRRGVLSSLIDRLGEASSG